MHFILLIKQLLYWNWWYSMVSEYHDIISFESGITMNQNVWLHCWGPCEISRWFKVWEPVISLITNNSEMWLLSELMFPNSFICSSLQGWSWYCIYLKNNESKLQTVLKLQIKIMIILCASSRSLPPFLPHWQLPSALSLRWRFGWSSGRRCPPPWCSPGGPAGRWRTKHSGCNSGGSSSCPRTPMFSSAARWYRAAGRRKGRFGPSQPEWGSSPSSSSRTQRVDEDQSAYLSELSGEMKSLSACKVADGGEQWQQNHKGDNGL